VRAVVVGYANSGDVALGDPDRTVGYGAVAFAPGDSPNDLKALDQEKAPQTALPLVEAEKNWLLSFARKSLRRYLTTQTLPLARNLPGRLRYKQGAFVTLRKDGQLRGCIGSILPEDELGKTVGRMALYAALKDPRFQPVKSGELDSLEIEISVLSPLRPIDSPERIVIGRDGVLMIKDGASAVFLPQVATEENWDRLQLLENLCRKGGWEKDCWKGDVKLHVFQADVFSEKQRHGAAGR
jgi:AmmeMemoRadiSam system protein A